MSLLTARQQRGSDAAKVQTLVRRALSRADHLDTTMAEYYARTGTVEERAQNAADAAKARERARQAADEMYQIASTSDDLELRRRARGVPNRP